jgi:hypothetical protein
MGNRNWKTACDEGKQEGEVENYPGKPWASVFEHWHFATSGYSLEHLLVHSFDMSLGGSVPAMAVFRNPFKVSRHFGGGGAGPGGGAGGGCEEEGSHQRAADAAEDGRGVATYVPHF